MATYYFTSPTSNLSVTAGVVIGYDNVLTNEAIRLCTEYNERYPITRIHFYVMPGPSGNYIFKVELDDGRIWEQQLKFTNPLDANPYIKYNAAGTPTWWLFEEIQSFNNLRQKLIDARAIELVTDWDWHSTP